jgi:tRNA nucleotidyltransferase (CCA-adding enzyme)
MLKDEHFEVTTYRLDGVYEDSRHPAEVTFTSNLADDLQRRDFTINAMAYNPRTGLTDLHGGIADLENKVIRCVGDANERFGEDALRMMRAIRFSAQLGYEIEAETKKALADHAPSLKNISRERIHIELMKLITSPHPDFLRTAYETGLTATFFREFDLCMQTGQNNPHHLYSVGEHILHSMLNIEADRILRLTMLLHDIAKPLTKRVNEKTGYDSFHGHPEEGERLAKKILRRLKFDNETIKTVSRLVRYHDYDINHNTHINLASFSVEEAYIRRSVYRLGEDIYPLYLKVQAADVAAQSDFLRAEKLAYQAEIKRVYEKVKENGDCLSLKGLAVTGHDLIAAGIPAGKRIGKVLKAMLEEVLEHPEHNTKEYLLLKFLRPRDVSSYKGAANGHD